MERLTAAAKLCGNSSQRLNFFNSVELQRFHVVHLLDNPTDPSLDVWPRRIRAVLARVGQDRGDCRRLCFRKIFCARAEIEPRSGFSSINPVAHFDAVQIDLKNAFLAPEDLDQNGKIDLKAFANPASAGPQEYIFGGLLRDGAGPTQSSASLLRGIE